MVLHKWSRITDPEYEKIYLKAKRKFKRTNDIKDYPYWYTQGNGVNVPSTLSQ